MRVAIRADAGVHMGAGHVMRCLTLAEALRADGDEVTFFCRPHPGHRADFLRARGFAVTLFGAGVQGLPKPDAALSPPHANWLGGDWRDDVAAIPDADLLIVDHYALDARFERAMRATTGRILVIDDLADRPHDADLLLDQGLGRTAEDYAGLVDCPCLTGTNYALLRPEFALARGPALARRASFDGIRHVLLTMGGVDADNLTGQVIPYLRQIEKLTVVLGSNAPHLVSVREALADIPHAELLIDHDRMADLMTAADVAIGAVGATSWERCCLGLPTLGVVAADNQRDAAEALAAAGAMTLVQGDIRDAIEDFLALSPDAYQRMSKAAAGVSDGQGLHRVMQEIRSLWG